jgi:hypothetical protein
VVIPFFLIVVSALTAEAPRQVPIAAPAPGSPAAVAAPQGGPETAPQSSGAAPPDGADTALPDDDDNAPPEPVGDLPVSVERVQQALGRPPSLKLKGERPVFRVEVLGKKLTIEDILGPDYLKGPVPRAGMTHQEFLDMVTPKDYQGYAPYTNREAFTIAATSFALKWALQKAIHKYETAQQDRDREAARKEVQEALAELEKARLKAGLPPR